MPELGRLGARLSSDQRDRLDQAMDRRTLPGGAALLTAGQLNDSLYLVVRGELLVSLPFETGTVFVGTRGPGTWVGEVSLLTPGPATATVTAARDSELRSISASALAALTETHPGLVRHFVRALGEDLAQRVRNAAVVLESAPTQPPPGFFGRVFGRLFGARE